MGKQINLLWRKMGTCFSCFYLLLVGAFGLLFFIWMMSRTIADVPEVKWKRVGLGDRGGHEVAFSGGLGVAPASLETAPLDLSRELKGVLTPVRPGRKGARDLFVILNGSAEKIETQGRLFAAPSPKKYRFCKGEGPVSFEFFLKGERGVEVEQQIHIQHVEGIDPKIYQPLRYPLKLAHEDRKNIPKPVLDSFPSFSYLGEDLLLGQGAKRLKVGDDSFSLGKEEFLVFKEGRWLSISSLEEADGYPIAKWGLSDKGGVEIQVWGQEEGSYATFKLSQAKSKSVAAPSDLIKEARKRSSTQVSCLFKGKRMVIKKGDWVVQREGGWRILKTESQRKAFALRNEEAPLWMFDSFDKRMGKEVIVGRWFQPSRTETQEIVFPLVNPGRKSVELKKGRGEG